MRRFLGSILYLFAGTLWAATQVNLDHGRTIIEELSLENQTIQLHGTPYVFAKNTVILNSEGNTIGFKGLTKGQMIEFKAIPFSSDDSIRKDETSAGMITEIKVLNPTNHNQD